MQKKSSSSVKSTWLADLIQACNVKAALKPGIQFCCGRRFWQIVVEDGYVDDICFDLVVFPQFCFPNKPLVYEKR